MAQMIPVTLYLGSQTRPAYVNADLIRKIEPHHNNAYTMIYFDAEHIENVTESPEQLASLCR